MINTAALVADLQRDEGYRGLPYLDTANNLTIGYGRNLRTNPLSRTEATMLLQNDIARVLTELRGAFAWFDGLSEARSRALANLTFNLGLGGVLEFRQMLAAMEANDWTAAAQELTSSAYAKEVGARADRIAALFALS